jgi:hypothetical protein
MDKKEKMPTLAVQQGWWVTSRSAVVSAVLGIEAMSAAKMLGATALVAPMVMLAMAVLTAMSAMTVASANSAAIENHREKARFSAELTASAARGMESESHRREGIIAIHPQAPRLSKAPPHISA